MSDFLILSVAGASIVVLAVSSSYHVAKWHEFQRLVVSHAILARAAVPYAALFAVVAEIAVAIGLLIGLVIRSSTVLTVGLTASCMLFLTLLGYLVLVKATGVSHLCGCTPADAPVGGWAVARVGSLALLSALAAVASLATDGVLLADPADLTMAVVAGAALGVLAVELPGAMVSQPIEQGTR